MNKKFVGIVGALAVSLSLYGLDQGAKAQYFPPSGGGGGGTGTVGNGNNANIATYNGTGTAVAGDTASALFHDTTTDHLYLGAISSALAGDINLGGPSGSTVANLNNANGINGGITTGAQINLPTTLAPGAGYNLQSTDNIGNTAWAAGGSGSGTVDAGIANSLPYYNQAGTVARVGPNPAATVTINGTMHLGGNGVGAGALLIDSNNGAYQNMQTQTLSGNVNFFMPPTQSVQDQVYMGGSSGGFHTWNTVNGAVSVSSGVWALNPASVVGTNGATGGSLKLNGATSGSNSISVPAAAGTGITTVLPTVNTIGATVQSALANALDTVSTTGQHVYATAIQALANTLSVGKVGIGNGIVAFLGNTSGTTSLTVPAVAGTVTVTLPTVAETGATVQAAVANAIDTVSTAGAHTYATACTALGGVLTVGKTGTQGQVAMVGTTSGTCILTTPAAAGTTTITMPAASLTFPAANAAGALTNNGSGVLSYAASAISGFGGDGSAGAVTDIANVQVNATTVSMSSSASGFPLQVVNSTGTQTYSTGSQVLLDGFGYQGGTTNSATFPATNGAGPCPGFASMGVSTNGGGGGGGAGTGTTANLGGSGGGLTSATLLAPASLNSAALVFIGSGGGGGGGTGTANPGGSGGHGGGTIQFASVGAFLASTAAVISANGSAGTAPATSATGAGGGGGGGGSVRIYSRTSISLAVNTVTVKGGAGGIGGTTSGGAGAGGGGGLILLVSPSTTNSLVTANACAGGAAGTTVTGTNATAGGAGAIISVTATPNAPLITMFEQRLNKVMDYCKQTQIASVHGFTLNQVQVSRVVSHNMSEYIACMETANVPIARLLEAPKEVADEQRIA